jgi:hypothetical protein
MLLFASLFHFAASAAHGGASATTHPVWGGALQWVVSVNVSDATSAGPDFAFVYKYDALTNASRLEHGHGQHDEMCAGNFVLKQKKGEPCTVLHATDGWSYVLLPQQGLCCKCSPDVGIVAPHWLDNAATKDLGAATVDGRQAHGWSLAGTSAPDNTYYATADAAALPVQFFEHKKGVLKTWDFDLATYTTALPADWQAQSQPPAGCTSRCTAGICRI